MMFFRYMISLLTFINVLWPSKISNHTDGDKDKGLIYLEGKVDEWSPRIVIYYCITIFILYKLYKSHIV